MTVFENVAFGLRMQKTPAAEITPRYRFISEQKAGPVYITNFQLQKVDYAHLGTDEFTVN